MHASEAASQLHWRDIAVAGAAGLLLIDWPLFLSASQKFLIVTVLAVSPSQRREVVVVHESLRVQTANFTHGCIFRGSSACQ